MADNLPTSCAVVTKSVNLNFLELSEPLRACNGTVLPLIYKVKWRSWLSHCATSRKVAGPITYGVTETVALGSTQPLTEMSTRNIS